MLGILPINVCIDSSSPTHAPSITIIGANSVRICRSRKIWSVFSPNSNPEKSPEAVHSQTVNVEVADGV